MNENKGETVNQQINVAIGVNMKNSLCGKRKITVFNLEAEKEN